jgi:hypothetical protein
MSLARLSGGESLLAFCGVAVAWRAAHRHTGGPGVAGKLRPSVKPMAPGAPVLSVFLVNSLVVIAAVIIHYEFLYRLTQLLPKLRVRHRFRLVLGVGGALLAHAVEVWLFAFAYFLMHSADGWGRLAGNFDGSFMACVYFSFTTFTTLGFGDIEPLGELRYLTGIEALTGLVLITWTASFLFVEMQRYWRSS